MGYKLDRILHDLNKCPDCGRIQAKNKKEGDCCENIECESVIIEYRGRLRWDNENWDYE